MIRKQVIGAHTMERQRMLVVSHMEDVSNAGVVECLTAPMMGTAGGGGRGTTGTTRGNPRSAGRASNRGGATRNPFPRGGKQSAATRALLGL